MRMYTTTNTRLRHSTDPIIKNSSLSPGQSLRYLDFPTCPNRQASGHTNRGKSSKHTQHFLFFFQEHRPAPLGVGDTTPTTTTSSLPPTASSTLGSLHDYSGVSSPTKTPLTPCEDHTRIDAHSPCIPASVTNVGKSSPVTVSATVQSTDNVASVPARTTRRSSVTHPI